MHGVLPVRECAVELHCSLLGVCPRDTAAHDNDGLPSEGLPPAYSFPLIVFNPPRSMSRPRDKIVCVSLLSCRHGFLCRYVDQGGGKRPGAFAVYLEPWHADVFEVLELKKNHGKDELRAR